MDSWCMLKSWMEDYISILKGMNRGTIFSEQCIPSFKLQDWVIQTIVNISGCSSSSVITQECLVGYKACVIHCQVAFPPVSRCLLVVLSSLLAPLLFLRSLQGVPFGRCLTAAPVVRPTQQLPRARVHRLVQILRLLWQKEK